MTVFSTAIGTTEASQIGAPSVMTGSGLVMGAKGRMHPDDIRVFAIATPAMATGPAAREVLDINLGVIRNPKCVLFGFFDAGSADAVVKGNRVVTGATAADYILDGAELLNPDATSGFSEIGLWQNGAGCRNTLLAFEEYEQASRLTAPWSDEKFGAGAGANAAGYGTDTTYAQLGVGSLVGWYSWDSNGALSLGDKVELQACWLTQSGRETHLHIAFVNNGAAPVAAVNFKIAVYQ